MLTATQVNEVQNKIECAIFDKNHHQELLNGMFEWNDWLENYTGHEFIKIKPYYKNYACYITYSKMVTGTLWCDQVAFGINYLHQNILFDYKDIVIDMYAELFVFCDNLHYGEDE